MHYIAVWNLSKFCWDISNPKTFCLTASWNLKMPHLTLPTLLLTAASIPVHALKTETLKCQFPPAVSEAEEAVKETKYSLPQWKNFNAGQIHISTYLSFLMDVNYMLICFIALYCFLKYTRYFLYIWLIVKISDELANKRQKFIV